MILFVVFFVVAVRLMTLQLFRLIHLHEFFTTSRKIHLWSTDHIKAWQHVFSENLVQWHLLASHKTLNRKIHQNNENDSCNRRKRFGITPWLMIWFPWDSFVSSNLFAYKIPQQLSFALKYKNLVWILHNINDTFIVVRCRRKKNNLEFNSAEM